MEERNLPVKGNPMGSIKVSYEDLDAGAKTLRDGQKEVEAILGRLKTYINGLVQDGFVTEKSSVAFSETYESYNKGAGETIAALDGLATFLEKTAEALGSTDTELANALKG
jgi:WXG100 family type VII secretion target